MRTESQVKIENKKWRRGHVGAGVRFEDEDSNISSDNIQNT